MSAGAMALGLVSSSPAVHGQSAPALPENHGRVDARLFVGEGENQPLIVGFGGAEGGNLFAGEALRPAVDGFLAQGYAFLAIGYFGMPGIPAELDRISLEAVHQAIREAARNPRVNGNCVALIGGSKGGELALLLASYYSDIKAVIALVAGNAVFPALTSTGETSSFSFNGEPLPFVPVSENAARVFRRDDLRTFFEEMRKDEAAVERAAIAVERINGPILLISATRDELWPSAEMSEEIVQRLARNNFPYTVSHVAVPGGHNDAYGRPKLTEDFLMANLLSQSATGCPRGGGVSQADTTE
jgi:pimeloyl-ACP methyl ester carboxylesterase